MELQSTLTAEKLPTSWSFAAAPLGEGGGFITCIDRRDGRMVCTTDVFNAYIREDNWPAWKLLLRQDNMPPEEYDPRPMNRSIIGDNNGSYSVRIAPSDRDVIYVTWNGFLYRSTDGGGGFERTALPPKKFLANDGPQRRFQRTIDVHSSDPNRVLLGTNNDGCYLTNDGGKTWTTLDVPATEPLQNHPGKYLVAWGPDGVPWVHVFGIGLYHAPRGASGQFLFVGGPRLATCLAIGNGGTVYVCGDYRAEGDVMRCFRNGEWATVSYTGKADQVAVDPADDNHIFWTDENTASWKQAWSFGQKPIWYGGSERRGAGESEWLSDKVTPTYPAHMIFDDRVPNRIWLAEGVGVSRIDLPQHREQSVEVYNITLVDVNRGISEFIPTVGCSPPGNPAVYLGVMDKGVWRVEDDHYTGWAHPSGSNTGFAHVWSIDYARDDPQFLAALFSPGPSNGFSEDGGRTWKPFAKRPDGKDWALGGDIAVNDKTNVVLVEGNNGKAWFTKDGGTSFKPVLFNGVQPGEFINAYYVLRDCACADKETPGTFALLVNNHHKTADGRDAAGDPAAGIWVTKDGGETWAHTYRGIIAADQSISDTQFWQARLSYIPGRPGELLYSAQGANTEANKLVWLKADGAGRLIELPVGDITAFDFGPPAPGQDYPSLWYWDDDTRRSRAGLYVTYDWFATNPILVSRWPNESFAPATNAMVADRNVLGRCFLGLSGNGWVEAKPE